MLIWETDNYDILYFCPSCYTGSTKKAKVGYAKLKEKYIIKKTNMPCRKPIDVPQECACCGEIVNFNSTKLVKGWLKDE